MYDVDGNGVIDQEEMTKIVQAIYDMLGAGATRPTDSAEERAKNIFSRMDEGRTDGGEAFHDLTCSAVVLCLWLIRKETHCLSWI